MAPQELPSPSSIRRWGGGTKMLLGTAGSPPWCEAWGSSTPRQSGSLCFQHLNQHSAGRRKATNGNYLWQNDYLCSGGLPWKSALCL